MLVPKIPAHVRDKLYEQGRSNFLQGATEPFPHAPPGSEGYYMNAGWRRAASEQHDEEQREERRQGLDFESLDRLRKQLEALGITVPN